MVRTGLSPEEQQVRKKMTGSDHKEKNRQGRQGREWASSLRTVGVFPRGCRLGGCKPAEPSMEPGHEGDGPTHCS